MKSGLRKKFPEKTHFHPLTLSHCPGNISSIVYGGTGRFLPYYGTSISETISWEIRVDTSGF